MANDIKFRGEVNGMSAGWFCDQLDTLPARSSNRIYLNTPGGDIYAGGEMINSLRAAISRGCKFEVEIGSLCASMGAAFLAAAKASGAKCVCHANSEVMFHGCWSIVLGGADELTDQAKAMRDFNETVKSDLANLGVTDTDEWFSADREKWLNAKELLDLGLVDSIIEDCAKDDDFKNDAVKIAASLNHPKEVKVTEDNKNVVEPVAEPAEPTPAPVVDEALEARVTALANERFAKLQAKHEQKISNLTNERDAALKDLAEANASVTSLKVDIEKLTADLASMRDQLSKSESVRATIVGAAMHGEPEPEHSVVDHRAVLASLPPNKRAEYYKEHSAEIDR